MEYHIKNSGGDIIASFVQEYDRDYAVDALNDTFELEDDDRLVGYDD